jgi:hypothetical protein
MVVGPVSGRAIEEFYFILIELGKAKSEFPIQ